MSGVAGKKARVKISTVAGGAGVYNAVGGIRSVSHSIDGASVDDSEMGVDWMQRIQGLKDGKITLSGQRRLADAQQTAILNALLNDSVLYVQVLPDGGTTANAGFQQEVKVSKFASDSAVDGISTVSIELEGTGAITLV
jgi:predicted secreted protein